MKCSPCKGCIQSQCKPGFYGPSCDLPCSSNCLTVSCSVCTCEVCNITSGSCTNGCDLGFYGSQCQFSCPENCRRLKRKDSLCDQISGVCLNGCKRGFYGDTCNNTCNRGCKDFSCTTPNSTCVDGCEDGYSGDFCLGRSYNKANDSDSWDHDEIAGAVGGGFIVILWATVIVVLIFVIWRRRMKQMYVLRRNISLRRRSRRDSSRRSLRGRESECSTKLNKDTQILESHLNENLGNEIQSSVQCACSKTEAGDWFIHPENRQYVFIESNAPLQTSDPHVYCLHDENEAHYRTPARRASSEGDLSERSTIWKLVKI